MFAKALLKYFYLQVSFIKHKIKEKIDKITHTKKKVVNAIANIVAILTTAIFKITATVPAINPPKLATSKQVPFLHMHFLNSLHAPDTLLIARDPNKTTKPIAETINATATNPVSAVITLFENNTPTKTPAIMLIITSIMHIPLPLSEQL